MERILVGGFPPPGQWYEEFCTTVKDHGNTDDQFCLLQFPVTDPDSDLIYLGVFCSKKGLASGRIEDVWAAKILVG